VHNSALYIYFSSLHVSGNHVPIIRRNYCIYATLVFVTVWLASGRLVGVKLLNIYIDQYELKNE
jgi:hypothetical protein